MTFSTSVVLPIPPEEAFALVTEPERLRRWKTVSAYVDLRAGGAYRWTVTPDHVAAGTYREVVPGQRVVFGWGWEGSDSLPPDASTVTVTLEPTEAGTLVTLVHEGLPEHEVPGHAAGWEHFLGRLETAVAVGDAGPDEWSRSPAQLDPVVAASAVLASLHPVLRGVGPEHDHSPTPCADLDVRGLVAHLVGSMAALAAMAGGVPAGEVDGSVENRVAVAASLAIEAWRRRGVEGTVASGERPLPAAFAAAVVPVELLLHGWDLSVATGQRLDVSDDVVRYVAGLAEDVVPPSRAAGAFHDPVEPAVGAGPLDRLAAYAGRRG